MKYQEVNSSSSPKTSRFRDSLQPNSITSKYSHESKRAHYEKKIDTMDILHPSSYFPKPGASTSVFKSPERITGEIKRPITQIKKIEFTQNPEEWFFQEASPFQMEMVEIHNKFRANHDSPFLKLNQKMCSFAQKEAEEMAQTGVITSDIPYGVNLFSIVKLKRKSEATEACESWYKEGKKYKYDEQKQKNILSVGRFTQMIWAETNSLGVGLAKNDEKTFVVAFYFPKGNQQGKYRLNVLRPKSKRAED